MESAIIAAPGGAGGILGGGGERESIATQGGSQAVEGSTVAKVGREGVGEDTEVV